MKRRSFLKLGLLTFASALGSQLPIFDMKAKSQGDVALDVKGAILSVHDPVMAKHGEYYYLFCTGGGIPVRRSKDMLDWKIARGALVFPQMPEEAYEYVPDATNIWAPDISFYNDKYHLYYSVSTFGSNHSAIGLATNETLDPDAENFEWVDHGIVVKSESSDFYNAIDANLIVDQDDVPWLSFGSFWGGIKLVKLDYETGKVAEDEPELISLATREDNSRAVEAPFIIYRDGYYYLFVSYDFCCQGINSTYNVRVGRSETVTGPYFDKDDVDMMDGGGTQITFPDNRYVGPGHNSIFREDEQDYIVYHAYDAYQGGQSTLRIQPLEWDEDGWPYIPQAEEA